MNTKVKALLKEKIKDMGLSEKALDELSELASAGLGDTPSDDDINNAVNIATPFAKAMQAEITRKAQSRNGARTGKSAEKPSNSEGDNDEGTEANNGNEAEISNNAPAWFVAYQKATDKKLQTLTEENKALKVARAQEQRAADIATKAKGLGIPDYLLKRVHFADDADIDKELTDFKQELVTNNLMPESAAGVGDPEAQLKADAKTWAEGLPDK